MEKKFLIYIDILGFEELGKGSKFLTEEEIKKVLTEEEIKKVSVERVQNKINELKNTEEIKRGEKQSPDSWLLFAEEISDVFYSIHKILEAKLPFEIAIGCKEFEKHPTSDELIFLRDETMSFLKNDLLSSYKSKYKDEHNQESIKETFIVINDDFYKELKNFYKKSCDEEISYAGKHFYHLPKSVIEREAKISDFLKEIGQSKGDLSGGLIDRIFVPPDNYEEIKNSLEKDRIVFITGTAGYGKTYLAIRLLWEKYNEGYIPKWISIGSGSKGEIDEVAKNFINIEEHLKTNHIIYFEDPFGKTKSIYETRDVLREEISSIIPSAKNSKNCYVVITSRKDVFEEFKKESYLDKEKIEEFEKELNIIKPSYTYEKRKEILENWAEEKGCEWLKDEKLKNIVFDSIRGEKLPLPHNIHDFAEATIKINNETELEKKIDTYSQQAAKAFADEIIGLFESGRNDRMLFLSFIFVSEYFEKEFVKQEYEKLREENFEDFEKILKTEYRVEESEEVISEKVLNFTHSSYSQALPFILKKNVGCKNIFCGVLKELADKESAAEGVARAIVFNFEKLPEKVRNELLLKLADKELAAKYVAWVVAYNFEKLPEKVRNLLFKLADKESAAGGIARAIVFNFEKLPGKIRNKLLLKLAKKKSAAGEVAYVVAYNFEKLSKDVKKLLFKLIKKESVAGNVAFVVSLNFENFPKNVRNKLLLKLADKELTAEHVAHAIVRNFEKLPGDVRKLLFKLADKESAAVSVAYAIACNFEKLPDNVRNKLLLKLADKKLAAEHVAYAIACNFEKLPDNVRNELLLKLADKELAAKYVAWVVAYNFEKLHDNIRNLIFTDKVHKGLEKIIKELSNSTSESDREDAEQFKKFLKNA